MNNTNLHIYEKLMDCYNSGDFWNIFFDISEDVIYDSNDEFKIQGRGTFKTYFSHLGYEMVKNNQHSIASLAELNSINSFNHKHHAIKQSDEKESFVDGEIAILLRSDILTRPNSIVFLEFNDEGLIKGMYLTYASYYSYTEIQNNNKLSYFELNNLAIDEAEKLFKSQGFTVERTEIQVQTIPHLRIYGADEYNFNVFICADNYPFTGQSNKKVEDYLVFSGMLNFIDTKFMYAQVLGKGKQREIILPNDSYSIDFKTVIDISQYHQTIGDMNK